MELKNLVKSASIETRTSKAGKDYEILVITFSGADGREYKLEVFLKQEQTYILTGMK